MWGLKKDKRDLKLFEEQIYLIYKDLYRYIYSIARNSILTEDALQNTLEKAYKGMKSLREQDKFKAWIFSIARNETITLIKKYSRESYTSADNAELSRLPYDEELQPEEYVISKEMRKQLIEVINQLKPEYKDLIILRYYAELSLEEISTTLNVNINTVKTRHMRAKEKIAKIIKSDKLFKNEDWIDFKKGGGVDA